MRTYVVEMDVQHPEDCTPADVADVLCFHLNLGSGEGCDPSAMKFRRVAVDDHWRTEFDDADWAEDLADHRLDHPTFLRECVICREVMRHVSAWYGESFRLDTEYQHDVVHEEPEHYERRL